MRVLKAVVAAATMHRVSVQLHLTLSFICTTEKKINKSQFDRLRCILLQLLHALNTAHTLRRGGLWWGEKNQKQTQAEDLHGA